MGEILQIEEPFRGESWIIESDYHGSQSLSDGMPWFKDPFMENAKSNEDPYVSLELSKLEDIDWAGMMPFNWDTTKSDENHQEGEL